MPRPRNRLKKPVASGDIPTAKIPSYLGNPTLEDRHISWRFSAIDVDGPYKCVELDSGDLQNLFDRLQAFEKMNVAQLRDDGSYHRAQTSRISKPAKVRLQQLELDDIEELYSFRIMGACRLWCIKHESLMVVLWWDSNHEVIPVNKRHT